MLFCFRYKKLLMPYVEGALGMDLRPHVENHVSRCPSCAAELAELQSVSSALKTADVPAAEPAPDLWMRVQQAITEPVSERTPWWQLKSYHIASAAAIAGVFLVAVLSVQLPIEKRIPEPAPRLEAPGDVQQHNRIKPPSLAAPEPVKGSASARSTKVPSKAYSVHPDTSASLSPKQAPLRRGRVTKSNGPAASPAEPVSESFKRGVPDGDFYADSTELKTKADIMQNEKTVRSPFSQIGRASGGSQNAALIEKSQKELYDYPNTDKSEESIEAASKPMAPAAAPLPGQAAVPTRQVDSHEKNAPGTNVKINEPLVVADAPGSALGSAYNVAPPLTKSSRSTAFTSNDNAEKAAGYVRQDHGITAKIKRLQDIEGRIRKNPKDAGAWLELADFYEQAGQTEQAKDACRKAIEFGDKAIKITAEAKLKKLEGRKK